MGNPYLNLGEGTGLSGGATTTATPPPPPPVDLTDPSLALEVVKMPNEPTEEPLNWRRRLPPPLLRIPDRVSISFLLGHGLHGRGREDRGLKRFHAIDVMTFLPKKLL